MKKLMIIPLLAAIIFSPLQAAAEGPAIENDLMEYSLSDENVTLPKNNLVPSVFSSEPIDHETRSVFKTAATNSSNLSDAEQWEPMQTIKDNEKPWTITFSSPVSDSDANLNSIHLYNTSGQSAIGEIMFDGQTVIITPWDVYRPGEVYTLLIDKKFTDQSGRELGKDIYLQFRFEQADEPDDTVVMDLYSALYAGLTNMDDFIDTSRYSKDSAVVFAELRKVLEEHPELFYFQYKGTSFYSTGRFAVKYAYPKEQIVQMKAELEQAVRKVYSESLKPAMSEFEQVKAIHDYVVKNAEYDYDNYLTNKIPAVSYTMYGLLVNRTAVCEGYALSMSYLLNRIGIETIYVRGTKTMNHAWNKVNVDGSWYNLDATWDDPVPDKKGKVRHTYFLLSDEKLAASHEWDNTGLPAAVSDTYAYMSRMWTSDSEGGWMYYANKEDDISLYKIHPDGNGDQKINDVRLNELVVHEGWIYFSNYSYMGYLFKMRTDGSGLTMLTEFHSSELEKKKNILFFKNKETGETFEVPMK